MFVVLEGVDGSGTTTQARLLADSLTTAGQDVVVTREPSNGSIGRLIRDVLVERNEELSNLGDVGWISMTMLFSADRIVHVKREIEPWLAAGKTVICDRYYYSTLAYQLATSGRRSPEGEREVIEWIKIVNSKARIPTLTIVLDASIDKVINRIRGRGLVTEIMETRHILTRAAKVYKNMHLYFPEDRIVHVDADKSIEEVKMDVVGAVMFSKVKEG